jgi:hypothetical protein
VQERLVQDQLWTDQQRLRRQLEIAIRRLRRSRYPRFVAAAAALAEVHRVLVNGEPPTGPPPSDRASRHVGSPMTLLTGAPSVGTGAWNWLADPGSPRVRHPESCGFKFGGTADVSMREPPGQVANTPVPTAGASADRMRSLRP